MPAALAIRSPTVRRSSSTLDCSPKLGRSPRPGSRRGYYSNLSEPRLQRTVSGSPIGTREQVLACLRIQATLRRRLSHRTREQTSNEENEDISCAVCFDDGNSETPWPAGCGHSFCAACTERCLQCKPACCPLCRAPAPLPAGGHEPRAFELREAVRSLELQGWAREMIQQREAANASARRPPERSRARRGRFGTWLANEINDLADFILS